MKKLVLILIFFTMVFIPLHSNQSVEEIIKGRKAMFSENYQNAKKISILLKSKKIDEAKPLMMKISNTDTLHLRVQTIHERWFHGSYTCRALVRVAF